MAQSVLDLILRTKKIGNAEQEATTGLKGMASGLAETALKAISVTAALGATVAVIKASVNETVDYNKTIREMTLTTGLGAEELSRLIQVGDDWGISVDSMRTAMQMAVKNGFQPSIENLAKLADEYVNTKDKTEFAAKAVDIFGRGWTTLIPILSQGGDALRSQAEAVDASLIATDQAIQASRDYEVAMDGLGDAATGLKLTLGNELVPTLTQVATGINKYIQDALTLESTERMLEQAVALNIITTKEYVNLVGDMAQGTADLNDIQLIADQVERGLTEGRYEATIATEKMKGATELLTGATDDGTAAAEAQRLKEEELKLALDGLRQLIAGPVGEEYDRFIEKNEDLRAKGEELRAKIQELEAREYLTDAQKEDLDQAYIDLEEVSSAMTANADAHEEATGRILFNMAAQKLAIDGFNEDEILLLDNIAKEWGLIDDKTYEASQAMAKSLKEFAESGDVDDAIGALNDIKKQADAIPRKININIHVTKSGVDLPKNWGGPGQPKQMGGAVWKDMPTIWNEPITGGEVLIPAGNGYILNMRQAQAALAGAVGGGKPQTVNNFYLTASYGNMQSESSLADDVRMLMAMYGG